MSFIVVHTWKYSLIKKMWYLWCFTIHAISITVLCVWVDCILMPVTLFSLLQEAAVLAAITNDNYKMTELLINAFKELKKPMLSVSAVNSLFGDGIHHTDNFPPACFNCLQNYLPGQDPRRWTFSLFKILSTGWCLVSSPLLISYVGLVYWKHKWPAYIVAYVRHVKLSLNFQQVPSFLQKTGQPPGCEPVI